MAGVLRSGLTGIGIDPTAASSPEVGLLARLGERAALVSERDEIPAARPEPAPAPEIVIDAGSCDRPAPALPPSGIARSSHPVGLLVADAREAALVGTAWHHLMEQVEWIESWDDAGELGDQALVALLRERMPGASPAWCADRVKAFHAALEHTEVRTALSKTVFGHETPVSVRREWRWLGSGPGGAPREGVIDRVVLGVQADGPGKALIIDWKTDQVPVGGHAEHAERYREQMASYRAAVVALEGLDPDQVETRLVFLRDGTSVELALEADQKRISD